jgi:aspartyl-tRNA(Asn)/glutamyl-tRNA(Gln) amidotransferase subunit C
MVSTQKVKDVAENARINLEEDEAKRFAKEFESILEVFDKLDQIDTDDVEPAFHPIDTGSEARKDIKEESLDKKEVFQNTENEEDGYFKGPSV